MNRSSFDEMVLIGNRDQYICYNLHVSRKYLIRKLILNM